MSVTESGSEHRTDLASPEPPEGSSAATGRRLWIVAVILVLLLYPAVRWLMGRSAAPAAPAVAMDSGAAALQTSFEHYQAGRYEDAISSAKAALTVNPNSADAYNNLAVSYVRLRRFDEALDAAQNALRLRPDYQLARNNLAWIQRERAMAIGVTPVTPAQARQAADLVEESREHAAAKRFTDCVGSAERATKLDPTAARAFSNLGYCQASLEQWDEGIRNTQEALRLDPALQIARNNLAWMQRSTAGGSQRK